MDGFAYYGEKYEKLDEISLPLSDRSIYFGDAVYDAAIGRCGKLLFLEEHLTRFRSNATRLGYTDIPSDEELCRIFDKLIALSGLREYFLYFQLSATAPSRRHSRGIAGSALLSTVTPYAPPNQDKELCLITYPDRRYGYCDIKTVNLLPAVLASCAAEEAGADEAVFYIGNQVTECAHSNISILKDGMLITHPTSERILPGITRAHLLRTARDEKIAVTERPFTLNELFAADEVLISSTSKFCLTAKEINGRSVGGGDRMRANLLKERLFSEYFRLGSAKK